ncbi:MAG: tetratricopeptide repeat protein [Rhodospirillales bacterium]
MADDAEQNALIKEVDEDLRQERLEQFWKSYGKYVIGACVAVVVAVGGNQLWKNWQIEQTNRDSATFQSALENLSTGKTAEAASILEDFTGDASAGYQDLGRLTAAAVQARGGDLKSAIASYDRLAADDSADPSVRKLARLYAAMTAVGTEAHADVTTRLEPLAGDPNWRFLAWEVEALSAQSAGDNAAALAAYKRIADAGEGPANIRRRATQMISVLGG